ncbi:MAG: DNA polymerase subunit beta [Candidatus Omnitrophota bacterium]|nr:MAG: DNA polymerase subunit beta [Candidatus Omnitrophota bacterium]
MEERLVDILLETFERKRKYFENYKYYCNKIKEIGKKILKDVKVLVFGSIVKNKHTPDSDIDVLIISDNLPENWEEREKIRTEIKSKIDPFSPFQIHLSTREEFENWYKNFIKSDYIEI